MATCSRRPPCYRSLLWRCGILSITGSTSDLTSDQNKKVKLCLLSVYLLSELGNSGLVRLVARLKSPFDEGVDLIPICKDVTEVWPLKMSIESTVPEDCAPQHFESDNWPICSVILCFQIIINEILQLYLVLLVDFE